MTKVKICGITSLEDAELAIGHGAWAIGFLLWKPSKRYVDPAVVAGITRVVRRKVETVGGFVNQPLHEIATASTSSGSATCNCTVTKARRSARRSPSGRGRR